MPLVHGGSDSETSESESDEGRTVPQRSLRPRGSQPRAGVQRNRAVSESPRSGGAAPSADNIGDFGMSAAAVLLGASRGDMVGAVARGSAGARDPSLRHAVGRPDSKHASSDR